MRKVSRVFLTGLMALLPVAITIYILYKLVTGLERALGNLLPGKLYYPGMGLLLGILIVFLIGLSLHAWAFRRLFAYGERLMQHVPLVSVIYSSARALIGFFKSDGRSMNQVVMVTLGNSSLRLIGFVTREDFSAYPEGLGSSETVAVFFPMSYAMGGYTAMVPRSAVQKINMPFQEAMRFALTAGMSTGEQATQPERGPKQGRG